MGEQWKQCQTLFFGVPKSLQMVTAAMKLKDAYSLEGKLHEGALPPPCIVRKDPREQSSLSGKESAQGCLPKRLLVRPD